MTGSACSWRGRHHVVRPAQQPGTEYRGVQKRLSESLPSVLGLVTTSDPVTMLSEGAARPALIRN